MRARILLLLPSLFLFNCNQAPTLCECDKIWKEIKQADNKPTEPDDPRIEMLQKCEKLHESLSEEEKKSALNKIKDCK